MVRISRALLKDAGSGLSKTLSEILVCPLSKQPLRYCEASNSLISDAIGVSFPIKGGVPCLVPKDGRIIEADDAIKREDTVELPREKMIGIGGLYPGIKDALFCCDVVESCVMERAKEVGCEALAHSTMDDDDDDGAGRGREWCCVCLSKVMEGEEARVLPCLHEFHKICVERWFHECQKTCPICRFWMRDEDGRFWMRDEDGRTTQVLTEEMVIWFTSFHVVGY